MENKYLKMALTNFSEALMCPLDESWDATYRHIDNGSLDLSKLKEEIDSALDDDQFNWLQIAKDAELLEGKSIDNYTNTEIKYHVLDLLYDELFPERIPGKQLITKAAINAEKILKKNLEKNNHWIDCNELYSQIKIHPVFERVQRYDMRKILIEISNIEVLPESYEKFHATDFVRLKSIS